MKAENIHKTTRLFIQLLLIDALHSILGYRYVGIIINLYQSQNIEKQVKVPVICRIKSEDSRQKFSIGSGFVRVRVSPSAPLKSIISPVFSPAFLFVRKSTSPDNCRLWMRKADDNAFLYPEELSFLKACLLHRVPAGCTYLRSRFHPYC